MTHYHKYQHLINTVVHLHPCEVVNKYINSSITMAFEKLWVLLVDVCVRRTAAGALWRRRLRQVWVAELTTRGELEWIIEGCVHVRVHMFRVFLQCSAKLGSDFCIHLGFLVGKMTNKCKILMTLKLFPHL